MIKSLQISGYRGLSGFELSGLGRVNLLVGKNNSGKTSVLEAIDLLCSNGELNRFWQILLRRGEYTVVTAPPKSGSKEPPPAYFETGISHMFHGHEIRAGSKFSINAKNESSHTLTADIVQITAKELLAEMPPMRGTASPMSPFALRLNSNRSQSVVRIPLTSTLGIRSEFITLRSGARTSEHPPVQFISSESLGPDQLMSMWGQVSLTPDEALVIEALQFLDSDIERIATITSNPYMYWGGPQQRSGFSVKLRSSIQPVPIGSMGDGVWRLLALSIALALCKGGVLLVDEIDTGLHYTVMTAMWNIICNAAARFNVQVFATSHSWDCIYSLSQIARMGGDHSISVQRLEPSQHRTVPFTEDELAVVGERDIEVR